MTFTAATSLLSRDQSSLHVFWFSHAELDLKGHGSAVNFLPMKQKLVVLESPWVNVFLGHRRNWWVCLIVVCPCWPSVLWTKTGRTKKQQGICTMQYFQSFVIVLFLFFLFKLFLSSVGLSVLNIVILLFYKKMLNKFLFFIWQLTVWTYIASEELPRWTDYCKIILQILLFWKCQKPWVLYCGWRKHHSLEKTTNSTEPTKQTHRDRHTDFFYSSDILLKKCFNCWYLWKTAMHVQRCW